MAAYTPLKPYGSRWNYRTPSPPPSSVIEPISPVETMTDSTIIFPNPSTVLHLGVPDYKSKSARQSSNEEPRSDSTLTLLSSVSPPSVSASRRPSPNTMERAKGPSEVPTFAGNQYFDPLAFFADVALSSADPTTLPKLQKLAAKDAAQRLESSPAEHPPPHSAPEISQNGRTRIVTTEVTPRRLSTVPSPPTGVARSSPPRYFLPPVSGTIPPFGPGQLAHTTFYRSTNIATSSPNQTELIELAPIRDFTPPSSNASITGNTETASTSGNKAINGLSVSPQSKAAILPSPPLAMAIPHSNADGDVFPHSPAKRSRIAPRHSLLLEKTNATESSTNTKSPATGPAQEPPIVAIVQPSHTGKGKKRGRGGKAAAMGVDGNTTTPVKVKEGPKARRGRISTPNIAVRRSTRNIKYIEEPEEQIIRPAAQANSKDETSIKPQANPQRIVLHLTRNHGVPPIEKVTKASDGASTVTVALPESLGESSVAPAEHSIQPLLLSPQHGTSSSLGPIDQVISDAENLTTKHETLREEDAMPENTQSDNLVEQNASTGDDDMMSGVDEVLKQDLLDSTGGNISELAVNHVNQLVSNNTDQQRSQINTEPLAVYKREFSEEPQAILDALEEAPPPPPMRASPSPIQQEPEVERKHAYSVERTTYQPNDVSTEEKVRRSPDRSLDRSLSINDEVAATGGRNSIPKSEPQERMDSDEEESKQSLVDGDAFLRDNKEHETGLLQTPELASEPLEEIVEPSEAVEENHNVSGGDDFSLAISLPRMGNVKLEATEHQMPVASHNETELEGMQLSIPARNATPEYSEGESVPLTASEEVTMPGLENPLRITESKIEEADIIANDTEMTDVSPAPHIETPIPEDRNDDTSPLVADSELQAPEAEPADELKMTESEQSGPEPTGLGQTQLGPIAPESIAPERTDVELAPTGLRPIALQPTEPEFDEPELEEPELDGPELDGPELDEPELDEPELDEPEPMDIVPIEPGSIALGQTQPESTNLGQTGPGVIKAEVTEMLPAAVDFAEEEHTEENTEMELLAAEIVVNVESPETEPETVDAAQICADNYNQTECDPMEQVDPAIEASLKAPRASTTEALETSLLVVALPAMVNSPTIKATNSTIMRSPDNIGISDSIQQGAPDTPPNNDLCLVCNSSTFLGSETNPIAGQPSGDTTVKWIECDNCKRWTHNACVNLTNEEVDLIDKYHCASCEKDKGPSTLLRKSARARIPIDYESLNNGSTVPVQSATNKMYHPWVDKILNGEFKTIEERFPRVVPGELTLQFLEDGGGFKEPVVIPAAVNPYHRKPKPSYVDGKLGNSTVTASSHAGGASSTGFFSLRQSSATVELFAYQKEPGIEVDALGMGFPDNLTIRQIVDMVGPEETVEVIDVRTQLGDKRKWSLAKWVEYFEDPNKEKVYNVISLEVSKTRLARLIQRPRVVREMDLSDQVWPKDKWKEFPMVQYYCLMSVAHSYTDWHVDFGGSSVYYRILKGRKVFFFLAPTEENLNAYQRWNSSPEQHHTWLAEGRQCYRIELGPGDTMLIPSGWLHAVYTPEDSLVIGGNFLTRLHYNMQFRIHDIEKACHTPIKYRFPRFARVHWYDAIKLMQDDPIPKNIDDQLISGKAANFRPVKGKGGAGTLSQHFLEGLPAVAEFLRRNSLIAQEIITEGLTKQKTDAVRAAIPKGFDDGWETVQLFARWVTWKRNCGEVIPPWAHPDADPAEGVPNAGQRKISAAAVRHAERLKADADRRASGATRSGLRERNQSTQRSVSGTSETPVPEEMRGSMKRPRLNFDGRKENVEHPRKKSRCHKEILDQKLIDECVDQVVEPYENSGDPLKEAIAVEVRAQYRNVHIIRLGPSRSACAPCREGKTKCVHKDEIRRLMGQVIELYQATIWTRNQTTRNADEGFWGEQSPQPEGQPIAKQLEPNTTVDSTSQHDDAVLQSGSSHTPAASAPVLPVINFNQGATPKIIKRSKSKKDGKDLGERRRRGGKRTACDACRKSRRKCAHGLDGTLLPSDSKSSAENEAESDEDRSTGEDTSMYETVEGTDSAEDVAVQSPKGDNVDASISHTPVPVEHSPQETRIISPKPQHNVSDEIIPTSPIQDSIEKTVNDHHPLPSELPVADSMGSRRSEEIEASRTHSDSGKNVSWGKRKRVTSSEEDYMFTRVVETKSGTSAYHKRLPITPSPSSRYRPAVPTFEESTGSPKKPRVDDVEASPMGNRGRSTPEKQVWQEMKAAEFGFRKRSKSKSSS